jgi:membrane-associated protein
MLGWVRSHDGPWGYVALGLAAAIEYVMPPFPGDVIVLFGAFLAANAGWSPVLVWLVCTASSVGGSVGAYGFGGFIGRREERWPRWLRTERTKRALAAMELRFERQGALFLAANRFIPAFRSLVFVAAGIAGVPLRKVVIWGGVSAGLWNAMLLAAGWTFGTSWERLQAFGEEYTRWALIAAAVIAVSVLLGSWWRKRAR